MSTQTNKSSNKDTIDLIKYGSIGFICFLVTIGLVWLYIKYRDAFLVVVSTMMLVGSFLVLGMIYKEKANISSTSFKVTMVTMFILALLNVINIIIFLIRLVKFVGEKKKLVDASDLKIPEMEL